jgi:hypothetical protein
MFGLGEWLLMMTVWRFSCISPMLASIQLKALVALSFCLVAPASLASGITWEEQQRLMPAAPQRPSVVHGGQQSRICWERPPKPTVRIDAYDPAVAFFRVYRVDEHGSRIPIGETTELCFIDQESGATTGRYVVTAVTRSGHESDISEETGVIP